MKKHTKKTIMTFILISVCALSLFSCQKEPPTVAPESTSEPETTIQLGCGDNHNFVDGYCTECGKQEKVEAVESLEYTQSEDGSYYTVSGIGTVKNTEITVPEYYDGKPIKAVGDGAFKYQTQITAINLPDSIEMIGKDAFRGCTKITDFTVPRSLKTVGEDAFHGCKIKSIEVKSFGAWCEIDFEDLESNPMHTGAVFTMDGEPISKIVFDNSVSEIKKFSFAGCTNLLSVVFSADLNNIGEGAFFGCNSITEISLPRSLNNIADFAFTGCRLNGELRFEGTTAEWESIKKSSRWNNSFPSLKVNCTDGTKNCTYYSDGLEYTVSTNDQYYLLSGIGSCTDKYITVPPLYLDKPVKKVAQGAFEGRDDFYSIEFSENMIDIEIQGFKDCVSLKRVVLPDGFIFIRDGAFRGCTALEEIVLPSVRKIDQNAFRECSALRYVVIPENVVTIYAYTFYKCTSLESVILPNSLSTIESWAFEGCSSLSTITFPASLDALHDKSFAGCTSLKRIELNSKLYTLNENAFQDCTGVKEFIFCDIDVIPEFLLHSMRSLEAVTLPSTLRTLKSTTLSECSDLKDIYYEGSYAEWQKITKEYLWCSGSDVITLHCTDRTEILNAPK